MTQAFWKLKPKASDKPLSIRSHLLILFKKFKQLRNKYSNTWAFRHSHSNHYDSEMENTYNTSEVASNNINTYWETEIQKKLLFKLWKNVPVKYGVPLQFWKPAHHQKSLQHLLHVTYCLNRKMKIQYKIWTRKFILIVLKTFLHST